MNRTAIVAIAAVLAVGGTTAIAQQVETPPPPPPPGAESMGIEFVVVQGANEHRLRDLLGRPVANAQEEALGNVNDLILDRNGGVIGVVVGVGGFLGIGEKNVAIAISQLELVEDQDGNLGWMAQMSRDSLADAPAFDPANETEIADTDEIFLAGMAADDLRLADIQGRPVQNAAGETLGNINEIVFSSEQTIRTVVVGVGGFLGIGQKRVGMPFDSLTPTFDDNGNVVWVSDATREMLEGAPAFMTIAQAEDAAIGAPDGGDAEGVGAAAMPFDFAALAAEVAPAVVSIRVRIAGATEAGDLPGQIPANPEGAQRPRIGQGSGFFISADGYVVTNNHVVADAEEVVVALGDGSILPATIIGTDPRTDLALLKVDANQTFPFVQFAEEPPQIGDWVLAVGNPYGLGGTVTLGIVSALGRNIGAGPYDDFMQIDAAINRGNSGGPSFNLDGQVIGVNTAIFSPTGASVGIGFATPAYIVADVVADLQDDGVVERGWLGVQIQPVDHGIAEALRLTDTRGAIIAGVVEEAPAARAGLENADVVRAVNGEEIEDDRDLARTIAAHEPGEEVQLTIWRNGAETTVTVQLGELPDGNRVPAEPDAPEPDQPEAAVQGIGLSVATAASVGVGQRGLVVVSISPGGLAARTPLQSGDIILEADGQPIDSPQQLVGAIEGARAEGATAILLRVMSGESQGFVGLPIGGGE